MGTRAPRVLPLVSSLIFAVEFSNEPGNPQLNQRTKKKKKKKKNRERVLKESFFMYFCTFKDLKRYVLKCSAKMLLKKKKISESSIKDKQVKITPILPKKKWEDRLNKSKMWIIAEA